MIYRNPKDAVLAEYKRQHSNKTGDLPKNITVLGGENIGWKRDIIRVDGGDEWQSVLFAGNVK